MEDSGVSTKRKRGRWGVTYYRKRKAKRMRSGKTEIHLEFAQARNVLSEGFSKTDFCITTADRRNGVSKLDAFRDLRPTIEDVGVLPSSVLGSSLKVAMATHQRTRDLSFLTSCLGSRNLGGNFDAGKGTFSNIEALRDVEAPGASFCSSTVPFRFNDRTESCLTLYPASKAPKGGSLAQSENSNYMDDNAASLFDAHVVDTPREGKRKYNDFTSNKRFFISFLIDQSRLISEGNEAQSGAKRQRLIKIDGFSCHVNGDESVGRNEHLSQQSIRTISTAFLHQSSFLVADTVLLPSCSDILSMLNSIMNCLRSLQKRSVMAPILVMRNENLLKLVRCGSLGHGYEHQILIESGMLSLAAIRWQGSRLIVVDRKCILNMLGENMLDAVLHSAISAFLPPLNFTSDLTLENNTLGSNVTKSPMNMEVQTHSSSTKHLTRRNSNGVLALQHGNKQTTLEDHITLSNFISVCSLKQCDVHRGSRNNLDYCIVSANRASTSVGGLKSSPLKQRKASSFFNIHVMNGISHFQSRVHSANYCQEKSKNTKGTRVSQMTTMLPRADSEASEDLVIDTFGRHIDLDKQACTSSLSGEGQINSTQGLNQLNEREDLSNHLPPQTENCSSCLHDPSDLNPSRIAGSLRKRHNCVEKGTTMSLRSRNKRHASLETSTTMSLRTRSQTRNSNLLANGTARKRNSRNCRFKRAKGILAGYLNALIEKKAEYGDFDHENLFPFISHAPRRVECYDCKGLVKPGEKVSCSVRGCHQIYHLSCARTSKCHVSLKKRKFKCPQHVCMICKGSNLKLLRCARCPIAIHRRCSPWPESITHLNGRPGQVICWRHEDDWKLENKHKGQTNDVKVCLALTCFACFAFWILWKFKEALHRLPIPYSHEDFYISQDFWKGLMENENEPPPYVHIKRNVFLVKRKRDDIDDDVGCSCDNVAAVCSENCICRIQSMSCSRSCHCSELCSNKPFRKEKKLKIVKTESCGWGAEAGDCIKKGEFIIEYTGEVINDALCEERLWEMKHKGAHNFYMCEIGKDFIIDATFKGNLSRFLNHSCDSNCKLEKWRVDGETRVGIFAARDIMIGEPLTYNYRFIQFGPNVKCHCGAATCQGDIGEPFGATENKTGKTRIPPNEKDNARQPLISSKPKTQIRKSDDGIQSDCGSIQQMRAKNGEKHAKSSSEDNLTNGHGDAETNGRCRNKDSGFLEASSVNKADTQRESQIQDSTRNTVPAIIKGNDQKGLMYFKVDLSNAFRLTSVKSRIRQMASKGLTTSSISKSAQSHGFIDQDASHPAENGRTKDANFHTPINVLENGKPTEIISNQFGKSNSTSVIIRAKRAAHKSTRSRYDRPDILPVGTKECKSEGSKGTSHDQFHRPFGTKSKRFKASPSIRKFHNHVSNGYGSCIVTVNDSFVHPARINDGRAGKLQFSPLSKIDKVGRRIDQNVISASIKSIVSQQPHQIPFQKSLCCKGSYPQRNVFNTGAIHCSAVFHGGNVDSSQLTGSKGALRWFENKYRDKNLSKTFPTLEWGCQRPRSRLVVNDKLVKML